MAWGNTIVMSLQIPVSESCENQDHNINDLSVSAGRQVNNCQKIPSRPL